MAKKPRPPVGMRGIGRPSELSKLPPERYQQIMTYVRLGAYDHAAACACGVVPATFYRWKRQGEQDLAAEKESEYADFYQDLCEAQGLARVLAEVAVKKDSPLAWLSRGPGRTKEGLPGWTDALVVQHEGKIEHQHEHDMSEAEAILGPSSTARLAALAKVLDVYRGVGLDPEKVLGVVDAISVEQAIAGDEDEPKLIANPHHIPSPEKNGNGNGGTNGHVS